MTSNYETMIEFSDNEDEKEYGPVLWEDVQTYQMPFGKHKGVTMKDMVATKKTRACLAYYLKWDDLNTNTADRLRCALAHYENLKAANDSKRAKH